MERRDADKRDVASVPSHDRLSLLTPSLVPTQLNAADGALVLHELALRVMSDEERARRGGSAHTHIHARFFQLCVPIRIGGGPHPTHLKAMYRSRTCCGGCPINR